MSTCVFCGSADALNTEITVTLDDQTRVTVLVCDTDAEEATPKRCREAYVARQAQIDEVLAKARALGLDLAVQQPAGQRIAVVQQATAPVLQPPPAAHHEPDPTVSPLLEEDEDGPVISTAHLLKPMKSVGGNVANGAVQASVPAYQSHALDELGTGVLGGKAKVTVVMGRGGQPLQLPSVIQDRTGTTRVRVVKPLDDAALQRRFKSMADQSRGDLGPDFRNGYEETERTCPVCRGKCSVQNAGRLVGCPKCGGLGVISV